jgi:hypothetical protein
MKKIFIKYTFLIFTFSNSLTSDELYITGESFHSNVSSFIKNIDPNTKVSISTREISGSRDSFIIKGLRIYDSSYGSKEILKIEELQCSGYKANDYKFNVSLSKFFKIPSFEDINKSIKTPSNCSIKGLDFSFLKSFLQTYQNPPLNGDSSKNSIDEDSIEFIKLMIKLFTDIDIDFSRFLDNKGYNANFDIVLGNSIFLKSSFIYSAEINEIHNFLDTFFKNVVFKHWGYQNYEQLYSDIVEDTSEIYLDFIADFESNPSSYYDSMPFPLPEILLKNILISFSWSEKEFQNINESSSQIEKLRLALKVLSIKKLSKNQFNIILEEFFSELPNEESNKIIIANTYDIYSSFIDAIKEFSKKPHSLELTLDSTNGINIVPDLEVMLKENNNGDVIKLDNYQFISSMMVIDNILSSDDTKLRFEANSKTK